MRAIRWESIERSATRGLSGLLRHNLLNLQKQEQHAFRPLGRQVFQSAPEDAPHSIPSMDVLPTYYEPPPPPPPVVRAPPLAKPVEDDTPLANRMVAMEWQRRLQRLVAHVNTSLPQDCHVAAYQIVPAELFVGEVGRFLMMACDFYSHCFANTLFLPTTASGASQLGLPQHPMATQQAQLSDSRSRIIQLRTRVANEHNRVAAALERGDVGLLFKQNNNRPDYKQELASICKSIAINAIGLSSIVTHQSRFGEVFGAERV